MRDANRLDNIYNTLLIYHKLLFPDLRFFQFIEFLQKYIEKHGIDPFYLEDVHIIRWLENYISELNGE